ncbi:bifunctional 2-polyprenyl-6-hydroxyphenol methylase/3-demethylubiquinol 3-O-methyltransferase UbiG [Salinispora sp. H7-4]|uniref:class I SAM-dependent methyltransferase n=1 Tax=Salinispora sp. H7-4 TaxID=2748321 RepID=UPI0015D204B3|nr:class I SAM-dependent methyltransferase [Salinispora sp. H7-4]NYT92262.1 class I SAM-dependent methyltransferase [Salinispora sp. H7-4]
MGGAVVRAVARALHWPLAVLIRPYPRLNALLWEAQYALGRWNYLDRAGDHATVQLIHRWVPRPRILDLGCGSTVNLVLPPAGYRHYHGVDISRTALRRARSLRRPRSSFQVADVLSYQATEAYDVILLREVLYYFPAEQAIALLHRMARALAPGGVLIVWLYDSGGAHAALAGRIRGCGLTVYEEKTQLRDGAPAGGTFVLGPAPAGRQAGEATGSRTAGEATGSPAAGERR